MPEAVANTHTAKKTILFVLPTLTSGGAERVLITLMNGMNTDKYEPVFLSISNEGELEYLIDESTPRHSLNTKLSPLTLPRIYFKLKELKPDIVISTMAHTNFAMLGLKPLFPKTKFIVREAITPSFLFQKYKPWNFILKALYKNLYPSADHVLSPSEKIFDEFDNNLRMSRKSFTLMRNPVDVQKIRQDTSLPQITQKRKNTVNFIACGRLGKQKGFDQLIESLAAANIPQDWTLDILGEGDERKNLEALIKKHNFEDKITLRGLVQRPYKDFAAADCFLLPSRFEGLPNVVLESLACGTTVIATKESGGIDEIAKEAPENAIRITDDMGTFIETMKTVKPIASEDFRESLLPDLYQKENVLNNFNDLIHSSQ